MQRVNYFAGIVLAALALTAHADESCTVNRAIIKTVSFGVVNVQRDTPVGSEIARVNNPEYADVSAFSSTGKKYCEAATYMVYLGGVRSPVAGVYNTNLEGVGIKVNNTPQRWYIISLGPGSDGHTYPVDYDVTLVKTGKITPGKLTAGLVSYGTWDTNSQYFMQISIDGNSTINVQSCSLSSQVMNFNLGTVSAAEFGSQAGFIPGREATLNLGLDCDPGANINVELKGAQNPDAGDASVLALSGQGGEGVADGVGVQLLYNSAPLQINNRIALYPSAGGQESLPITARYYQTKPVVTAGDASATATLDITYQ